ncbi:MAG: hypothetical protein J1F28_02650 [Oscillospiraceae bacterium]|nr:hypothetical protein [Oscillospiraceae bacterium]
MTFDELIAQGIRDTLEKKCAELCKPGKKHRFSAAYKKARTRIIRYGTKSAPLSDERSSK